jgi:sugar phosphate isomerase/epimerase
MSMQRREFLSMGAGFAGACALGGCACLRGNRTGFKLAMAGYTLNRFKTDEALDFCEKHSFRYLCVKDFHLPFKSTAAEISEFKRKCADHGVTPYGVGPIYMDKPEDARRYFDYAAALGVGILVGVPGERCAAGKPRSSRRMCEEVSKLTAEYGIRFAIHNHGRNPKTGNPRLYPAVPETWELIRDLDPRLGLCVDWAYTYADGLDCVEVAEKYHSRIFDGHVRCLSDAGNGSAGINPAKRVFDYDDIFAALRRVGYSGCLGLELANAFPANPQWISESREYFEGLM